MARADGTILLVRVERRGMRRWELPTAIRKGEESLLLTVFRCVEEDSSFHIRVKIGRPVCFGLNKSQQLGYSYFAIFFECTVDTAGTGSNESPEPVEGLPAAARQKTLDCRFVNWRELNVDDLHPQHREILQQWSNADAASGMFAVESDADQEARFYTEGVTSQSTVIRKAPAPRPAETTVELEWVHVSDIHFGSNANRSNAEKQLVVEAIVRDVQSKYRETSPDCIFVTGDVAFSGKLDQYRTSLVWIRRLADAARIGLEHVWLVPGNHDVRRDIIDADPTLNSLHLDARNNPQKIDEFIADPIRLEVLQRKLKDYSDWVNENFNHMTSPFDWSTMLKTRTSNTLLLAGLCTVWVSDADDGVPNQPGIWSNNMFVSRDRSLSALKHLQTELSLVILLTHHPRSWLCRRSDNWLETLLWNRPVVHLCGHVHEESAGILSSIGANRCYASIINGAVHGGDELRHGYSWGQLRFQPRTATWYLGWAPRAWTRGHFAADSTNYPTLDSNGYCWEQLGA